MKHLTPFATIVVALAVLASCSSTPPVARDAAAAPSPQTKAMPSFEQAVRERLSRLPPAPAEPTTALKSAADGLRQARQNEAAIEQDLRSAYAKSGVLPDELVERLKEARDARFDAVYRVLVDDPSAGIPEDVYVAKGGVR